MRQGGAKKFRQNNLNSSDRSEDKRTKAGRGKVHCREGPHEGCASTVTQKKNMQKTGTLGPEGKKLGRQRGEIVQGGSDRPNEGLLRKNKAQNTLSVRGGFSANKNGG